MVIFSEHLMVIRNELSPNIVITVGNQKRDLGLGEGCTNNDTKSAFLYSTQPKRDAFRVMITKQSFDLNVY